MLERQPNPHTGVAISTKNAKLLVEKLSCPVIYGFRTEGGG